MGLTDLIISSHPVFRRKLFPSEKSYILKREQDKGEEDIIGICKTAKREYSWIFFKDTSNWVQNSHTHVEEFDPQTGDNLMTVFVTAYPPNDYLGHDITNYHIHPDYVVDYMLSHHPRSHMISKNYVKSLLAYPSKTDLLNSMPNDRKYKVVTSLGVTTYKLHSEDLFKDKDFNGIQQEALDLCDYRPEAYSEWLQCLIEKANEKLGEYATIHFKPAKTFK